MYASVNSYRHRIDFSEETCAREVSIGKHHVDDGRCPGYLEANVGAVELTDMVKDKIFSGIGKKPEH